MLFYRPQRHIAADGKSETGNLFANLLANHILMVVQNLLILFRDVPTVLAGHFTLFLTNLPIFRTKLMRLCLGQFSFPYFLIDPLVLVFQSIVDLVASRMSLFPLGVVVLRPCAAACGNQGEKNGSESGFVDTAGHCLSP
jgi:hypothetical protein